MKKTINKMLTEIVLSGVLSLVPNLAFSESIYVDNTNAAKTNLFETVVDATILENDCSEKSMKDRFVTLCNKVNMQGDAEKEFSKFESMYSQKDRDCHNIVHIEDCLYQFSVASHLTDNPDLVSLQYGIMI